MSPDNTEERSSRLNSMGTPYDDQYVDPKSMVTAVKVKRLPPIGSGLSRARFVRAALTTKGR